MKAAGGDATVFTAKDNVDAWSDDHPHRGVPAGAKQAETYGELARDIEAAIRRAGNVRRTRGTRAPAVRRLVDIFRERLIAAERIDFFGSAGRDRVLTLLAQLESRIAAPAPAAGPGRIRTDGSGRAASRQGRLWITRPRPGVDRMASAWLIRRFIDRQARFGFAVDAKSAGDESVPFDMFGVEFSHQGDGCTFETLCSAFGLDTPPLSRIAAIVHDLDLKDGRFGAPECSTSAR